MNYNGTIYRPPVEANTFLLPITEGCTHGLRGQRQLLTMSRCENPKTANPRIFRDLVIACDLLLDILWLI